jgi:hypothetical protein
VTNRDGSANLGAMGIIKRRKSKEDVNPVADVAPAPPVAAPTEPPPLPEAAPRTIDLVDRPDPALGLAVKKLREGGHLNRFDTSVYAPGAGGVMATSEAPRS